MTFSDDVVKFGSGFHDALGHASAILLDQCLQDLVEVEARGDRVTDGFLFSCGYLPRSQAYRYDSQFLRCFARSIAVVGWKLEHLEIPAIGSVAEGLAAFALLKEAELFAYEQELVLDLEPHRYLLFSGTSILTLFDPACDGIHAIDGDCSTSLDFDHWFAPFRGETAHLSISIKSGDDMFLEEI